MKNLSPELIKNIIEGDTLSFRKLYEQTSGLIYYHIHNIIRDQYISEDIMQEAYVKLWKERKGLNSEKNTIAFLKRIAINLAIDHYRKKSKNKLVAVEEIYHFSIEPEDHHKEESNLSLEIEKAIDSLPPRRKMVFILSKKERLTYKEIAEHMNISVKTVEHQMGQALKELRTQLKPALYKDD